MSLGIKISEVTGLSQKRLESIPIVQDILNGKYPKENYINLLKNLYPIVLNFCPIMAAAASRCKPQDINLQNYLYEHIFEEKRHEKMILDDLLAFDIPLLEITDAVSSFPVQAMIAFNYHMQDRSSVYSVLGMIYVLEVVSSQYGDKVASGVAKNMNRSLDNGFSFLSSHSTMDVDHMLKLKEILQLIHDPVDQNILFECIKMNFYFIAQIIRE
jgi:pyrroloquinoline quinone (PQQ) biosynthesis protein C